ncbi:MAG: hypothetical protein EOP83_05085 [Verrucomicrobiaceae bacterium]|nr:MAG: hypothetical protein EOP83_05085 [Verrucomicrobiaceae bacterium]
MGVRFSSVMMQSVNISTVSALAVDIHSSFDFTDAYYARTMTPNLGERAFGPFTAFGYSTDYPRHEAANIITQAGKAQFGTGAANGTTVGLSLGQHGVFSLRRKSSLKGQFDLFINNDSQGGWFFFGYLNKLGSVHSYIVEECIGFYFNLQSGDITTQRKLQNGQMERVTLPLHLTTTPRTVDMEIITEGNSVTLLLNNTVQAVWSLGEIYITAPDLFAVAGFSNSNTQINIMGPRANSLSLTIPR